MTVLTEPAGWTGCICSAYTPPVADQTPDADDAMTNRAFRIRDEDWAEYGRACKALGTTRSDDLRRHVTATIAAYRREQRRIAREQADAG